ncbi:MAG: xanthine dehydrogenase family protein subunit M [Acidobacteriota bacterium]|nr:xanthine dehydrogenase family protein subunit M [Acidobacteriota bacterium]MDQ3417394.1 xanthine dehydrogenase family protein subunit M [Acidobacteriota bacterium]
MRSWLAQYAMESAASLDEALRLLAREPGKWTPFAGGTDIMVLLEAGKLPKRNFLSIWSVPGLREIVHSPDILSIGALSTYSDLLADSILQSEFPLLCAAARETGALAIQNRGTIGGNIANASPAADVPPALLVYDATLEIASTRGRRRVDYARFHTGYKQMDLAADELIVAILLPRGRSDWKQTYRKVGTRRAQAISKICFAAAADIRDGSVHDVRIALGSVAPTVIRATSAEAALRGRHLEPDTIRTARAALARDILPIDDIRSTAVYRHLVAGNLLEGFLS